MEQIYLRVFIYYIYIYFFLIKEKLFIFKKNIINILLKPICYIDIKRYIRYKEM